MWWLALDMQDIPTLTNQLVIIIGALVTLVTAVSTLIVAIRSKTELAKIHEKVNGNLTAERDRVQQLTALLSETPTIVPPQEDSSHG
jgi:hypothetical protein